MQQQYNDFPNDDLMPAEFKSIFLGKAKDAHVTNQKPHTDYNVWFDEEKFVQGMMPYSVLLCVQANTYLEIDVDRKYDDDDAANESSLHKVLMEVGDLLIWSGCIMHAGGVYIFPNFRIFGYYPTTMNQAKVDGVDAVFFA